MANITNCWITDSPSVLILLAGTQGSQRLSDFLVGHQAWGYLKAALKHLHIVPQYFDFY